MIIYPITIPGGSDTEIQYNNGGIFGGDSAFTFDDTNKRVHLGGETDGTAVLNIQPSTGDASILLASDPNNATESENPYIEFTQDGGAVTAIMGMQGAAGEDPKGNAYTGTLDNSFLLGSTTSHAAIHLGTNDTTRMTVTTGGRVGIGINTATKILETYATSNASVRAYGDGTNADFESITYGTASRPGISGLDARGTKASPTATQSGDIILFFGGRGYGATGFAGGSNAAVVFYAAENYTDAAQGTYMDFETTPSTTTSRTSVLRIFGDSQVRHLGPSPYYSIWNNTHEDTDGGGETRFIFRREDGAGTASTAAQIEGSHGGSGANDTKGMLQISVNNGTALTDVIEIDEDLNTKIGDAGTTNYTKIEADGTIEFNGAATVWGDANVGAMTLTLPVASQPDEVNFLDEGGGDTGIATWGYAVGENSSGAIEFPHSYKEGSNITPHVHWQGITAPTGTDKLKWQLTYTVAQGEATLDAATTIVIETDFDTQYEFKQSDFPAITGTNFNMGDQFLFILERIAASADEYGGDGLIATVGFHYEKDTVGSRQITTK